MNNRNAVTITNAFLMIVTILSSDLSYAADPAPTATTSPAPTVVPLSDQGYSDRAAALKATTQKVLASANTAKSMGVDVPILANLAKIDGWASSYSNLHGACVKSQSAAKTLCLEETSPTLQSTLNQVNTLVGLASASGITDACSTMGKALAIAQAGLTAYTAACSAARATCEGSCSTVFSNIKNIKSVADAVTCALPCRVTATTEPDYSTQTQSCNNLKSLLTGEWQTNVIDVANLELNENDTTPAKSIASKNKACTYTYASMVLSAGTGILSLVKSAKQAASCDDETNGTSAATATTTAADDCTIAANAQTTKCLCEANPRLPGCANELEKAGDSATTDLTAQSSPNATGATDNGASSLDLSSNDPGITPANAAADSSGAGVGAPVGGGGAGLSGGGGPSTGSSGNGVDSKKSALNANILGGASGGGGGGSWGAGSSSNADTKYRAYLPGGAKDPTKVSGEAAWTKEVTGQGGKSNWEKVRERYRDNTSSLIGN